MNFFDDVIISYDVKNSTLTVSDKNKKVSFTVTALLKSLYDENTGVFRLYGNNA